eukprot:496535-Rhodomonas_salina.5
MQAPVLYWAPHGQCTGPEGGCYLTHSLAIFRPASLITASPLTSAAVRYPPHGWPLHLFTAKSYTSSANSSLNTCHAATR